MFQLTGFLGVAAVWIGVVLTLLLHILLAKAVTDDCFRMVAKGREPMILTAFVWLLLVLLTGVLGFALFWAMHYSSWRDPAQDRSTGPTSTP
jgi:nitric oxide reductase large subunit